MTETNKHNEGGSTVSGGGQPQRPHSAQSDGRRPQPPPPTPSEGSQNPKQGPPNNSRNDRRKKNNVHIRLRQESKQASTDAGEGSDGHLSVPSVSSGTERRSAPGNAPSSEPANSDPTPSSRADPRKPYSSDGSTSSDKEASGEASQGRLSALWQRASGTVSTVARRTGFAALTQGFGGGVPGFLWGTLAAVGAGFLASKCAPYLLDGASKTASYLGSAVPAMLSKAQPLTEEEQDDIFPDVPMGSKNSEDGNSSWGLPFSAKSWWGRKQDESGVAQDVQEGASKFGFSLTSRWT